MGPPPHTGRNSGSASAIAACTALCQQPGDRLCWQKDKTRAGVNVNESFADEEQQQKARRQTAVGPVRRGGHRVFGAHQRRRRQRRRAAERRGTRPRSAARRPCLPARPDADITARSGRLMRYLLTISRSRFRVLSGHLHPSMHAPQQCSCFHKRLQGHTSSYSHFQLCTAGSSHDAVSSCSAAPGAGG